MKMLSPIRYLSVLCLAFLFYMPDSYGLATFEGDYSVIEIPFENKDRPVHELLDRKEPIRVATLLGIPIQGIKSQPQSECFNCDLDQVAVSGVGKPIPVPRPENDGTLFVRDSKVMTWDKDASELVSKSVGSSEIYIVADNKLKIVKVEVKGDLPPELKPADDLVSMKNLVAKSKQTYNQLSVPYEPKQESPSLRESQTETSSDKLPSVRKKEQKALYKSIAIQVLDERSAPEENLIYPLEGVSVSLPASDFKRKTNARGIVEIADIPAGSRFMVRVKDEDGRVLDQAVEIATEPDEKSELFRIRTLSYRSYFLYSNVFDFSQRSDTASLCVRAMSPDGAVPLTGISATIDSDPDGPYYIGEFGPKAGQNSSSANGRLCFFNVSPGLTEVNFYEGESYLSSAAIPLLPGHHLEDDVFLSNGPEVSAQLIALPSGPQIVYGDVNQQNQYLDVDYTDMIAVGENEQMEYLDPGHLQVDAGKTFYRGRLFGMAQGAEFETALYSFDTITNLSYGHYKGVTPLLQRGFVEDLFNELYLTEDVPNIAWDPALGSVFVRHGQQEGERLDDFNIRLVNHLGRDIQQPWLIGSTDSGFIQAIFFNLAPGFYTLIVESGPNHWIDATTVPVDYWLTSVVQTGAPLTTD